MRLYKKGNGRHRFLGFGSYVEPVQTVRSVFFLDLCEFLRRPQYLYYMEAGKSVRFLPREPGEGKHILYHNFSEKQKNKKNQLGKYTGSMRSIQKCLK